MSKQQQTELMVTQRDIVPVASTAGTVADILRSAIDNKADIGTIERMMALYERDQVTQAAAAFNAAVVMFQQECPIIAKLDKAYDKYYARMDRIWRTIRPLMERCGLAVTWESMREVNGVCVLEGHLRHARGHVQALHHEVPLPEMIKGQNSAQRAASGETYAKRYATCACLGIQTGDDLDGNNAAARDDGAVISPAQVKILRQAIEDIGKDERKFCKWAECDTLEACAASKYAEAMRLCQPQKAGAA